MSDVTQVQQQRGRGVLPVTVSLRPVQTDSGSAYPLYHTLYETYYLVTSLQDRGLHFTAAVTKMWGEMARR